MAEGTEFSSSVYDFLKDTREHLRSLVNQAGAPSLATEASALQHLAQLDRNITQAMSDLAVRSSESAPASEEAPARETSLEPE